MATYVCSDLHGHLDLLTQIQNFIKHDDTVFFLGDAGDRGPEPWATIKEVYRDGRFIYLKGNHEDMLVNAANDFMKEDILGYNYQLLIQNGGFETFEQWKNSECRKYWIDRLNALPVRAEYVNKDGVTFLMSHAGFTPNKLNAPAVDDLLWDRDHFYDRWVDCSENTVVIHGHTPISSLHKRLNEVQRLRKEDELPYDPDSPIYVYCGGHKVCIDNCTCRTGRTVLFNLDTYEAITFKTGE